jgi:uncharacterized protein
VRSTVVVLLFALALAGCTIEVVPPGGTPDAGSAPRTVDARVDTAAVDAREVDEQTAVSVVDEYWRREFARQGEVYDPPGVAGGYRGSSGPSCAGQPSVPGNAYYCPPGDFIAWDDSLMAAGYDQIGDAWVYLVIAHEWGHAIQARLASSQVSRAIELQADCLAGAAITGAANEGLVQIEEGDDVEISRALAAVADDFPWTDTSSHGNAAERTANFNRGSRGGVEACL